MWEVANGRETSKEFPEHGRGGGHARHQPATLRKWRATDTGPRFYKFNRSVFYKREDIEAWISEHYMLVEPKN